MENENLTGSNRERQEIQRDEKGRFPKGVCGNPLGKPKDTPEQKLKRKVIKEFVSEYKERLAEALPLLSPVLIAKSLKGDILAIRELNDRVMGKATQPIEGKIQVEIGKLLDEADS